MLFLSKENIEQSFSMQDAIQACKDALSMYSKGMAEVPLRTNFAINEYDGHSLYMPAYVSGEQGALGIKIASVYPGNVAKNLPSINAVVLSLDPKTGVVTACLDGTYLTQLRTGAVQGAATDLLARKDASIGALIGTGGQAASQLEAMLAVRNLSEVRVCGLDFERTTAFVDRMRKRFDIELIAVKSSKECVTGAILLRRLPPRLNRLLLQNGLKTALILMASEPICLKCVRFLKKLLVVQMSLSLIRWMAC